MKMKNYGSVNKDVVRKLLFCFNVQIILEHF